MSGWEQETMEKVSNEIISRAKTDATFRLRCLRDPHAVIEEIAGMPMPPHITIRFFEKGDATHSYVLPDYLADGRALSDEELEQVAGGGRCGSTCNSASSVGICF